MRMHKNAIGGSLLAIALATTGLGSTRAAVCNPNNVQPGGLTLRDLSRLSDGFIGDSPNASVTFRVCNATNTLTRTALNQPFSMTLRRDCSDEVPEFNAVLRGTYFGTLRLNDTHPNFDPATDPNPRIGYEYARGDVVDAATGKILGTFELNGVIGVNTCRKPMPDAIGHCYDKYHHEGYVTIKFTDELFKEAGFFGEYHFHTIPQATTPGTPGEDAPCKIDAKFRGVVDGIFMNRCGPLPHQPPAE